MRLPQRMKAETKRNKRNQTVRVIPSGFKLSEESRIFLFCGRTSILSVRQTTLPPSGVISSIEAEKIFQYSLPPSGEVG